ncbi:HAD family hydrolase [Variovorax sp. J22R133]|uniref:HAD family hydrolase n=1 Tax=Variovorax brevis TaxID=3053503 RepID=UPI002575CBE9|nr:HAD family hydrolase [Variovorax sp. J22R133]MDM0111083.1 HAD family hydrolase [Variovorax sp. J22R133]
MAYGFGSRTSWWRRASQWLATGFVAFSVAGCASVSTGNDALPSWVDGPNKQAIVSFVEDVTRSGSPNYVPPEQRVAAFDNDGTLWAEQPMYTQFAFMIDQVKAAAPKHPEWANNAVYKALAANDLRGALAGGEGPLLQLLFRANAGMSTDDYDKTIRQWIATARHPITKRAYTDMVYQPQLELLAYLRAKGFKTWIVSGGTIEFMRPWTQAVYGIPPEQVVGSSQTVKYADPVLMREPTFAFNDDGPGKPVGIYTHIGQRPILAFGNSDGDLQMLQYTMGGPGRRLALIVHHDDAVREFAYDRTSSMGKLDKAWDEAVQKKWNVVSMKNDWKRIYPDAKSP